MGSLFHHTTNRRTALLGLLGGLLAACGRARGPGAGPPLVPTNGAPAAESTTPALTAPDRPGASAPAWVAPRRQPGEVQRATPAGAPTSSPAPPPPVELVWQADGGPDRLRWPTGLAVDRYGALTVVDAGYGRLVPLATADGRALARLGGPEDAPGRFHVEALPDTDRGCVGAIGGAVAVDAEGSLYVADPVNGRIQRLDRGEHVVAPWGELPPFIGPLVSAAGIAVDDRRRRVYVADADGQRLHAFDRDGRWLLAWGGPGQGAGEFIRPTAAAVDRQGRVYVADRGNDRIQAFDGEGRFLTAWGGPGRRPEDFAEPVGVAVDGLGQVYVATAGKVLVFSASGVFLTTWGGADLGVGPVVVGGLAVDEQGGIYLTDQLGCRVLKVRPRGGWPTPAAALPTARPATPPATPGPLTPPPSSPAMTPTDR